LKVLNKKIEMRCSRYAFIAAMCWTVLVLLLTTELYAATVTAGARRFILDNGFTVILKQDRSAPVAAIQVWVKTGSANETEEEAGITHQIEHMIFKGTPTKSTGQIARTIEAAGGHINAYTSFDRTVYYVEIPSARLDTGLDVLLDAVQHSLFDPEELEREKEVVLEEYRRSLDIPEQQLGWALMDLCFKKHPYGRPIIGYEKTIRAFDRKAILNYMDKWYTPKNMVLVAVGDFEIKSALKTIKTLVADFPKRSGKTPTRPQEPPQTVLRKLLKTARVQQVYLDLAWHIPALTHPDMYPLDILEIILGHGKSSRLYTRLKMEANLVTDVSAGSYALVDPGLFSVDATLRPDKLDTALTAIGQEMTRLTRQPVSDSELDRARTLAEADFVFDMEDMAGQARTLGFFQTMTGDMYHADHYLTHLKKVTADDVMRVAQTYFRPENLSIGVMAPEGADITLDPEKVAHLFTPPPVTASQGTPKGSEQEPQATLTVLANGMRLIVKENHRLPEVSMTGAFLGGTRLERPGEWGISGFVAQMLTRGTQKRTAVEIAATVESWAGSLSGFSGRNSLGVSGKFLSKDLYAGLELLADVVRNPSFPPSEIKKVREDILAGIKAKKDRPTRELFDLFYRALTRSDLETWYQSIAIPSNFVLTLVGDLNQNQLIPYIKTLFQTFSPPQHSLPDIAPEPPLEKARVAHLKRPGAQTHLVVGYLGAGIGSPRNPAMALVRTALAGQGGRLFTELRDKQSLAYAITAFRSPGLGTGAFGAYMACDPAKAETATEGIFAELNRIREEGLTDTELKAAKSYLLGSLLIGLQTNGSQAMQMTLDELYGLGYNHLPTHIRDIEAVTLKDIQRVAREIILPGRYVLVSVGPGDGPPPVGLSGDTPKGDHPTG